MLGHGARKLPFLYIFLSASDSVETILTVMKTALQSKIVSTTVSLRLK